MIHIIANPVAGGGRAVPTASALARVIADRGGACHLHVPADRAETRRIAERVAPTGTVVACGGDGTVHDCLQGLMAASTSNPTLGIWPVGTGNDIIRGVPGQVAPDEVRFAESLIDDRAHTVDVGMIRLQQAESPAVHYFLGVMSCGFDSDVNERANAMPAQVGRARYLLGLARELPIMRPRWYAIDSDGTDRSMAAMIVAVGNGPAYGSGMLVCPGADMADGHLDVTVVTNTPKHTFASVLPKVYSGKHVQHPSVSSWQAKELAIDAPDSVVFADGERIGPLPATIQIIPEALRVLV